MKCVIYNRVSSKDQEKGYSIDSQNSDNHEYALKKGFTVDKVYTEAFSAKKSGRAEFNKMINYLKNKSVKAIITRDTERVYRNFKDYVLLDDLNVEIHLLKENEVISDDSPRQVKFMHSIRVVMAKDFIDNLRELTTRGMLEKARSGGWNHKAPFGYVNKRTEKEAYVAIDHSTIHIVNAVHNMALEGHSIGSILTIIKPEHPNMTKKQVHKILTNPFYAGVINYAGETYNGNHEAVLSLSDHYRILSLLASRDTRTKMVKRKFRFGGMLYCKVCGSKMYGEYKKKKDLITYCCSSRIHKKMYEFC